MGTRYVQSPGGTSCQNVINQAVSDSAAGDVVYLKAGLYTISNQIILKSNITLTGDKAAIIRLVANACTVSGSAFYVDPAYRPKTFLSHGSAYYSKMNDQLIKCPDKATGIRICGFEIDGNSGNNATIALGRGFYNMIFGKHLSDVEVHDMYSHDGHGELLRSAYGNGIRFYNNVCARQGHEAFYADTCSNAHAWNNEVAIRVNSAIRFYDVTNSSIHHNNVYKYTTAKTDPGNPCFQIQRAAVTNMSVDIYNNVIHDGHGCGLWVTRTQDGSRTVATDVSSVVRIHNNLFYNVGTNTSIPYTAGVIAFCFGKNIIFENNTLYGQFGGGVVCMGTTDAAKPSGSGFNVTVKNNIFANVKKRNYSGTGTGYAVQNRLGSSHTLSITYNNIWNCAGGSFNGCSGGTGNVAVDPMFANPIATDLQNGFRLKSVYGRWVANYSKDWFKDWYNNDYSNGTWVQDKTHSTCINAGDPNSSCSNEVQESINRINMGYDGNTKYASLAYKTIQNPDPTTKPVAAFTASPLSGNIPFDVQFTDQSTGNPSSWQWNFDDGELISTTRNPVITFRRAGFHSASLTVTNSAGSNTLNKENYIVANSTEPPVAAFTSDITSGVAPLTVHFKDQSSGPTSWNWNIGDGALISTNQNPIITFPSPGTFKVVLTVTNQYGSDSITKEGYITVNASTPTSKPPTAAFTSDVTSGIAPLQVKFTDQSTNTPTTWNWNFGDSGTDVSQNPVHIYLNPGKYPVSLKVTNADGSDIETKTEYITVTPYTPFTKQSYDVRIREGSPDTTFVDKPYIDVGSNKDGKVRSLLWFNLDSVMGKTITKAILRLYWYYPTIALPADVTVEVYRTSMTWDPAATTWKKINATTNWNNAGGNWRDALGVAQGTTPYASITLTKGTIADKKYHDIDVTALVKKFIAKTNRVINLGFFLKTKAESNDYIAFYSSESGTATTTPQLVITETEEPPVAKTTVYVGPTGSTGMTYTCDGTDDHIQINQALKLVSDNPTKYSGVYLKGPFTYTINDTLLIGSNTILEGDSSATIFLKANCAWAAEKPMIKELVTKPTNITIRGFKIDGNRDNQSGIVSGKGYHNLIHLTNADTVFIYNMNLTNNHGDGLKTTGGQNYKFYNNTVYQLGHDALYASNTPYIEAYNNIITCRTNSGLRVYNCNHISFTGNKINSAGSGNAGIEIQKEGTPVMDDIIIVNNEIYNTALPGIWIFSSSSYNAATANIQVDHNKIYDTGTKNTAACAGIVINGFNAAIENNTIDGAYKAGILVKNTYTASPTVNGSLLVSIKSNIITNTRGGYGIIKDPAVTNTNVLVQNNCLFGNASGNYSGVTPATGNYADVLADPLYVDRDSHDYHLQSVAGRYNGTKWVVDSMSSPAIDAGDYDFIPEELQEPQPNGGRINCGMYGNTEYASMSGDVPIAVNKPPALNSIGNKTVTIGNPLTFTVTASDPDNDSITYMAAPLPVGATFDSSTGAFAWTPTLEQEGTYTMTFTASDGILSVSETISIGVIKAEILTFEAGKLYTNRIKQSAPDEVDNDKAYIDLGGLGTNAYRALVYTDLSKYSGKIINKAELHLYWYYPTGKERENDTIIEVYLPIAWDYIYASWNKRVNGVAWVNPGGNWLDKNNALNGSVPYASCTLEANTVPDNTHHVLDVTDLVRSYVTGVHQNTGFLLKAQVENNNYVAFYSGNIGLNSQKMRLVVEYTS